MKFMFCPLILDTKEKSKWGEIVLIWSIFTSDKALRFIN